MERGLVSLSKFQDSEELNHAEIREDLLQMLITLSGVYAIQTTERPVDKRIRNLFLIAYFRFKILGQNTFNTIPRLENSLISSLRSKIISRDGYSCYLCNVQDKLEVHHIKPRCVGGSNEEDNLITLCFDCHRKKIHIKQGYKQDTRKYIEELRDGRGKR